MFGGIIGNCTEDCLLFIILFGSKSIGLDNCSTERDNDELLSIDLENAFNGDNVGLQSFGVVAITIFN